ncbi:MAG TPA: hypothetical protein PLH19_04665 [Anaerolineae bacterium]|nr:hypothetical protein [Anaerolineae bacterium]HQH37815.1 hypothetical protein [Anaerolineae bacterium]
MFKKLLGGAARQKERGHCQVKRGRKSASSTRTVCSRWGIALAGRTRHLLYRSPPNSASSPTRLSPPVSGGETHTTSSALAGRASHPPRGLSRGVMDRRWLVDCGQHGVGRLHDAHP